MSFLTTFLISVLVLYLIYRYLYKRPANYPPGPRGFPLLGYGINIVRLHRCVHLALDIICQKHGKLVGIYFAQVPIVILSGYDAVKEGLTNEDLDGRPDVAPAVFPEFNKRKGIIFADGDSWRHQRYITMRHLRDFGFGRDSMDRIIQEEVQDLITHTKNKIEKTDNNAVQMRLLFGPSVINLLWGIVGGKRYNLDDKQLSKLIHIVEEIFRLGNMMGIADVLPIVRKLFPVWTGYEANQKKAAEMNTFLKNSIKEHQATFDPNHIRDFIDAYLLEMEHQTDNSLSVDELIVNLFDLFVAGSETTQNTLTFAFLYMAMHPDIQKKVQNELDDVVGRDRLPSLEDRSKLIYTDATVTEVFRAAPVAATTAPHLAMKDTKIQGYDIPKGTICMANIWSVLAEKEYWGDPEIFRPERHINSNGELKKFDHVLNFGAGKRGCPGEPLARRSVFLFFSGFIQAFNFSALPGDVLPDPADPLPGLTITLPQFKLKIDSRY